ncbi:MAG: hypothetical protein IPO92_05860 [Saprospiraceae bacterium]|nr:hypothetical protein [Saprospiraceae bacterium]
MKHQYFTFVFFLFLVYLMFTSCKNAKSEVISDSEISALEDIYQKQPTEENFNKLIQKMGETIIKETDSDKREGLLNYAMTLCEKTNKPNLVNTFAIELIKTNPNAERSKKHLWATAEEMKSKGKTDIAALLYKGFASLYPEDPRSPDIKKNEPENMKNLELYFKNLAARVFENPDDKGLNVANTQNYIDMCESYALVFPKDTIAPTYLFRAAEMSRAIGTFSKTMSLYDWICTYFPNNKNAAMAMFLKGFTLENDFKQFDKAKEIYDAFLIKYPNDPMAKDVKFLLENLGKSDKEIMEKIEKTNAENKKVGK